MIKKITFGLFVLFISTTVNAQWWGNGKRIKGNGNIVTVKRTTSDPFLDRILPFCK